MNDLLELNTGQVAFLSSILSGFSISVAVHILRHGMRNIMTQLVFMLLITTTLLFLIALYVDVRLTIELAGVTSTSPEIMALVQATRVIGTNCATAAFVMFVCSIGLLGWIARPWLGVLSSSLAAATLLVLFTVWRNMADLNGLLVSAAL